jgi:hypothetical protein
MEPVNALNALLDSKNRLMAPANALEINIKPKVFVVMLLSVKMELTILVTTFASNVLETALHALT